MKKVSLFFVAMCITFSATVAQVSVWDGSHTIWTNGTGTENDPYLIENAQQLAYLAYYVNNGGISSDKYWELTTNVDLNGRQWSSIGNDNSFGGNFDGNEHTIANLVVGGLKYAGLFGKMDGGSVKNIGIVGNSFIDHNNSTPPYSGAGGIAGYANNVAINNCYNMGSISSFSSGTGVSGAGGIVGFARNVIINNCYNSGSISSSGGYARACGIVGTGMNNITINNCYNTGNIGNYSPSNSGIARGEYTGTSLSINNCYNTGQSNHGIASYNENVSVNNCYYLNTSAPNPGGGISQTAAFMGTQDFVDLLNNGPTPNFAYMLDIFLINGGYPIHFRPQTLPATNVTKITAILNGSMDFENSIVTQQGFLFNNNGSIDTLYANIQENNISYNILDLTGGTTYKYRAFAIINSYTYLGQYVTFTTLPFNQNGDAFLIETQEDLILLANIVNGGNPYSGQEFILANDIVLPNTPNNIKSIGTKETNCPFGGIFNGNGKRIYNVYIDNPNTPYQGLFGYTQNAKIRKLGIENITASGRDYTGGMVGWAENTKLDTLYVKGGTLYSLSYCGGLIGYQTSGTESVITACYNHDCRVEGNNYVGGLLGYSDQGTVRNSWVAADVIGHGYPVGAVIGGSWKVLSYNNYYNPDYQCPDLENGDDKFKSGGRGGMTSEEMRKPEFVALLNQGLITPAWKMDYNPPINDGFPILIWQTNGTPIKEENPVNSGITVYPNPTKGELTIDNGELTIENVEIYDMMGRIVVANLRVRPNADGTMTINVEALPSGIYFLWAYGRDAINRVCTTKFVKQ
jgi:hypothetical protein